LRPADSVSLVMLDFGCCMITIPESYFCRLAVAPRGCVSNGVPIKTARIMKYFIFGEEKNSGDWNNGTKIYYETNYNFSAVIIGLLYGYSFQESRGEGSRATIRNLLDDIFRDKVEGFPSMKDHQSEIYFSTQFEKRLLHYTHNASFTECNSTITDNVNCSMRTSLIQNHSDRLVPHQQCFGADSCGMNSPNDIISYLFVDDSNSDNLITIYKNELDTFVKRVRRDNISEKDFAVPLMQYIDKIKVFIDMCNVERTMFIKSNTPPNTPYTDLDSILDLQLTSYEWDNLVMQVDSLSSQSNMNISQTNESQTSNTTKPSSLLRRPQYLGRINNIIVRLSEQGTFDDILNIHYWYIHHMVPQQENLCVIL